MTRPRCILVAFIVAGRRLFTLMGITLPAFQIAGSLLLLMIALDMLHAKRSAAQETPEETEAGASKDDIAITPLGVPMLAGPGAISTSLILMNEAHTLADKIALCIAVLAVALISYVVLRLSAQSARWLSPLALKLLTRLMGLLLAAIAVQFAMTGRKRPSFSRAIKPAFSIPFSESWRNQSCRFDTEQPCRAAPPVNLPSRLVQRRQEVVAFAIAQFRISQDAWFGGAGRIWRGPGKSNQSAPFCARIRARWTMFCNSRILPRPVIRPKLPRCAEVNLAGGNLLADAFSIKCDASRGMSSLRSRTGGT